MSVSAIYPVRSDCQPRAVPTRYAMPVASDTLENTAWRGGKEAVPRASWITSGTGARPRSVYTALTARSVSVRSGKRRKRPAPESAYRRSCGFS